MKRLKTGIPGFDKLIQGGIPESNSLLVCGTPGTCKTIFAMQYLYNGAMKGERGLYVTIEEKPVNLRLQAEQFGWNVSKLEKKKKLAFLKIPIDTLNVDLFGLIQNEAKRINAKRIVVDSLSILSINGAMYNVPIKSQVGTDIRFVSNKLAETSTYNEEIKQFIYLFINKVNDLGATTLFIGDAPQSGEYLTRDTVSEFACDGVVKLEIRDFGKTVVRTLEIKKMRGTNAKPGFHTLDVSKKGLEVKEFEY